jgi:hypothetical protein
VVFVVVAGQFVASSSIPLVVANLWRMRQKLGRIERLRSDLVKVSIGSRFVTNVPAVQD